VILMHRVKCVTERHFELADGRKFKHLFRWSFVPLLADFEKLLANCYELMTDRDLEIFTRKKPKKMVPK
jgi:hypothetical protein